MFPLSWASLEPENLKEKNQDERVQVFAEYVFTLH